MPIVPSRNAEIRRLIASLDDPRAKGAALARLRVLGRRVVAHVSDDLSRLSPEVIDALVPLLREAGTAESREALARIEKGRRTAGPAPDRAMADDEEETASDEATLLARLRALPPPRRSEPPSVSRDRAEIHLLLARSGLRLARAELLTCLETLNPERAALYAEAAGLIGDAAFVPALARLLGAAASAKSALSALAAREKISTRSRAIRTLPEPLRSRAVAALG